MTSNELSAMFGDGKGGDRLAVALPYVASLASIAPVAIFHADSSGRVNYVTEQWAEISGRSCLESQDHGWLQALHPEDRERARDHWVSCVAAASDYVIDYRVVRPCGLIRSVRVRAVPVLATDGRVDGYVGTVEDVSERVSAEASRDHYVRRLEILSAIDRAILDANSPETIAQGVVAQIGRLFPAIRVSVVLLERDTQMLRGVAVWSRGATALPCGACVPLREDVAGAQALEGTIVMADLVEMTARSWLDQLLLDEGVRSYMRVPMRMRTEVIGSLNISSGEQCGFNDTHAAVAQEVADRLAVAITNARLMEGVQATGARVAAMSQRMVGLEEAGRRDIARELHDEIGQVLTVVKLRLGMLAPDVSPSIGERIRETERLVDDLVANVRRLLLTLRPPLLDDLGLQCAVRAHLERFSAQTGIHVRLTTKGLEGRRLPLDVETAAFRIVQESLTNVARHAGSPHTEVRLRLDPPRHLLIVVLDNGCGFDPSTVKPGSAGLAGMSDRVALLGGSFRIDSSSSGTRITARIPIRSAVQS